MTHLFMGFAVDIHFEQKITLAPPLLPTYTGGGDYLEKITFQTQTYLGKKIPSLPSLEELHDLQKHIQSLALYLAPGYPIRADQIMIFPIHA